MSRPASVYLPDLIAEFSRPLKYELAGSTPAFALSPKLTKLSIPTSESARAKLLEKVCSQIADLAQMSPASVLPISGGCSQAVFIALAALSEPNDSLLMETPFYEPFPEAARFLNFKVQHYERTNNLQADMPRIRVHAHACSILLLTNPHFPVGKMYSAQEIDQIAKHFKYVIVDETYLPHFSDMQMSLFNKTRAKNVVYISGLSKTTGLSVARMAWALADPAILKKFSGPTYLMYGGVPTPSLVVSEYVFKNWKKILKSLRRLCEPNRRLFLPWVQASPDIFTHDFTQGNFGCLRIPKKFQTASDFCQQLEKQSIRVRSCHYFGMPRYVRVHLMMNKTAFVRPFDLIRSYYP